MVKSKKNSLFDRVCRYTENPVLVRQLYLPTWIPEPSTVALTSISRVKHLRPGFLEKYDNSPNFGLKAGIFTIKG